MHTTLSSVIITKPKARENICPRTRHAMFTGNECCMTNHWCFWLVRFYLLSWLTAYIMSLSGSEVNVEKSCLDVITFSDYYQSGVKFTAYTKVYEFVYSKPAAMVKMKLLLCVIHWFSN